MQIEQITPPDTFHAFKVARAFQVTCIHDEAAALLDWTKENLPKLPSRSPTWTWSIPPHGGTPLPLNFYFATDELAQRFLAYWPGKQLAA